MSAPPEGHLFQERLLKNPFWMLVACQLVNQTTWRQAKPAFLWLRATYRDAVGLSRADPADLHEAMRPLGLWKRRSEMLVRFARAWLSGPPSDYEGVLALPGCGKYAADSWAIFVAGRLDVEPNDGKLNWYVERQRTET